MTSVCRSMIMAVLIIAIGGICNAGDGGGDKWFARDKLQHFGYSAFLSGGSVIVAHRHFDRSIDDSVFIGIGITVSLGAAKEVIDHNRPGQTSSIKDFIWDIAGAVSGSLLASLTL